MLDAFFLATYPIFSNGFGNVLSQLEQLGFFTYVLPFLLIFAITFGVLSKTNILDNTAVNAVIAIAVGLMALQFNFVPQFFATIFPKLGMGLSVMLVLLILLGFSGDFGGQKKKLWTFVLFIAGLVIFFVILSNSFQLPISTQYWWDQYGTTIIVLAVIVILVVAIISSKNPNKKPWHEHLDRLLERI